MPKAADAHGAEPHHVPHGYSHPKERHHWWWYAGLAGGAVAVMLASGVYWQVEHAAAPLCVSEISDSATSPDGGMEADVLRFSCLGGAERQKVVMRKVGGGGHTVVSLDGKARIHIRWVSEYEVSVSQTGGRVWTFVPVWSGVRVKYQ